MTSTKKQKMDMAKAIVEAIHSKEPPGRFLKKCSGETGQWIELSKREAADKAAQAMAYAIRGESLKQKRMERRRRFCPLPSISSQPHDDVGAASSQTADRPAAQLQPHANHSAAHGLVARGNRIVSNDVQSTGELLPRYSNLQQQLIRLQQQTSATSANPLNNLAHILRLQHQQHHDLLLQYTLGQRQQQQQQQLLLQHALGQSMQPHPLTSLTLTPASLPPTLSLPSPSLSAPSLSDQVALLPSRRLLQNLAPVQSQSNPPNAYLLSWLSNLQNQQNG